MKTKVTDTEAIDNSQVVRSMIDRENDVINHRITWLTTIQGLFFASLGFTWDKPTGAKLIGVLCLLGIAVSVIQLFALILATTAIRRLCDWWETNKPKNYNGPGVMGGYPPKYSIVFFITFWNWIPLLFIIAWVIVWFITAG